MPRAVPGAALRARERRPSRGGPSRAALPLPCVQTPPGEMIAPRCRHTACAAWRQGPSQTPDACSHAMALVSCVMLLDLSASSLRRGHANLLCIVPSLMDDPRRESNAIALIYVCVRVCACAWGAHAGAQASASAANWLRDILSVRSRSRRQPRGTSQSRGSGPPAARRCSSSLRPMKDKRAGKILRTCISMLKDKRACTILRIVISTLK